MIRKSFHKKYKRSASEHDLQVRCRYKFTLFFVGRIKKVLCGRCEQRTSDAIYPRSKGSSACDFAWTQQVSMSKSIYDLPTLFGVPFGRSNSSFKRKISRTVSQFCKSMYSCLIFFGIWLAKFKNWFILYVLISLGRTSHKTAHYGGEFLHIKYIWEHWPSKTT